MTIHEIKEKGLLLLECISGSKAYGLDTATSDTDIKGVFYLPKERFYGLDYVAQVNNETNDEVYYELGRFVELLIKNNPNLLELLATTGDSVLYKHPIMNRLNSSMFLSKLCKDTFAGYAITQIRKARGYNKKVVNPVEKERKTVLDFCFVMKGNTSIPLQEWLWANGYVQERCGLVNIPHSKGIYGLYYDEANAFHYKGIMSSALANEVCLSSIPKDEQEKAYLFFNLESYSSYCREYRAYWEWVENRNETRYSDNQQHGKDYDAKNMMHTIRLLQVAEEIIGTGTLQVKRPNRDELLAIKRGTFDYDELLIMADGLMDKIKTATKNSHLPETPDREKLEGILIEMRNELYA
jgi:predicted nucleotidyltransferase